MTDPDELSDAASRCTHATDIDWPGHTACLKRVRCKNMTRHPSKKCWRHRPHEITTRMEKMK